MSYKNTVERDDTVKGEAGNVSNTSIDISQIQVKVPALVSNGTLKKQFKLAYSVRESRYDYALNSQNVDKNRYGRYGYGVPFDETRVVLDSNKGNAHSDYINASHVDGYQSPGRYIACQGPQTHTIDDMWRMVAQFGCRQIVMLTKSRSVDDWHCAKYWPDVYSASTFGDIAVKSTGRTEVCDHYMIRSFNLEFGGEVRPIVHYNYTSWPDWGVPDRSGCQSFLDFVCRVRDSKHYESAKPIVVHCSAGIGRTGSFILIDTMIEMAKAEKRIDIFKQLLLIREQRMNLVEAFEQYVFVHQVLLECLQSN